MYARWLVTLCFLLGACFDPTYPVGIPCSGKGTCPPEQICDVDDICRLEPMDPMDDPRCGDGRVEGDEACDDGNTTGGDGCSASCLEEECGNGVVDVGEVCDDGNTMNGDGCPADCLPGECGDGVVDNGEQCDDGNSVDGDGCSRLCLREECGNGRLDVGEACDDGNIESGDGCSRDCKEELTCGDGTLDDGEDVDPPPGPARSVPVDDLTCRYDFSSITQLYCVGTCGNWGGEDGCQQEDADALCKLRTDNPNSIATSFRIGESSAAPGLCCPPPTLEDPTARGCLALGTFTDRGVDVEVAVHDTDLLSAHGPGQVVTDVVCTDP